MARRVGRRKSEKFALRRDVYCNRKSPPKTPWTVLAVGGCLVLGALGLLVGAADANANSGGSVASEPETRCVNDCGELSDCVSEVVSC